MKNEPQLTSFFS